MWQYSTPRNTANVRPWCTIELAYAALRYHVAIYATKIAMQRYVMWPIQKMTDYALATQLALYTTETSIICKSRVISLPRRITMSTTPGRRAMKETQASACLKPQNGPAQ